MAHDAMQASGPYAFNARQTDDLDSVHAHNPITRKGHAVVTAMTERGQA